MLHFILPFKFALAAVVWSIVFVGAVLVFVVAYALEDS